MKDITKMIAEAEALLSRMENGQTYPSDYVVQRFKTAADNNSHDQLIGSMRDVIVKVAKSREYIHQSEIGKLYDEMYGISGGRTVFRDTLGDLLPADRQLAKVAHKGSSSRYMTEEPLEPIYKDSELSNAFSVLFSLGGDTPLSNIAPDGDRNAKRAVISKLSQLGYTPEGVRVLKTNEHFILCAASHKLHDRTQVTTLIPVQLNGGVPQEPKHIILGEEAVQLDSRNLFLAIKEEERNVKMNKQRRFASMRDDGTPGLQISKAVLPKSLESFAGIESALVVAASKFSNNQVQLAIAMLGAEFASFGAVGTNIKIASSNEREIIFDVHVPTRLGKSVVHVPVEISNGMPLLPGKFAASVNSRDKRLFSFNTEGFQEFVDDLTPRSESISIARHTGVLSKMSYHQLIDQIITGVSSTDYRLAEDALEIINHRFGSEKYSAAFDKFQNLIKHSSNGSKRKTLIKAAFDRGELIRIPTSVELYSPKLRLTVSKISFDEKNRMIPKGRHLRSANQSESISINTSQIVFT